MVSPKNGLPFAWMLALSLLTFVAYLPAMQGPFVFDDRNNIVDNVGIATFPPLLDWFNPASRWLVSLTFAINHWMSGWETWSFHATNVTFHIACGWLIAILTRLILWIRLPTKTSVNPSASDGVLWITSLWMLHPVNSSAVAYIVQRSEILASCAMVGFLIAIILDSQTSNRRWQWMAAAIFAAGICCKTNAVAVLPVAVLMDRLLLSDSWTTVLKRRGVLYLLPVVLGVISFWILLPGLRRGDAGVGFSEEIPSIPIYLATQCQVLWHYLALCVWPSQLCIDYRWPPVESIGSALPWILATMALFACGVWLYRKQRLEGWLILSVFLLLSPTSSFIPITDIAVDHRMYLASAAVLSTLVLFVQSGFRFRPHLAPQTRFGKWAIALLVLLALWGRTNARAYDWSSGFALWKSTAEVVPRNPRATKSEQYGG